MVGTSSGKSSPVMDGNFPLVSVVIPVYNVEDYLHACVQGIVNQTYKNLEILLIDDGSTDGSPSLCDRLASSDDRVSVFHKSNCGAAESRNFGVGIAKGEWIAFVDSDDLVSPLYVEALLSAALESSTLMASFRKPVRFTDESDLRLIESMEDLPDHNKVDRRRMLELTMYQEYETGPTSKLYHRSILDGSVFPKGNYYEDLACIYKLIDKCDFVAVLETEGLYGYRMNEGGKTSAPFSNKKAKDILGTTSEMYEYLCLRHPELSEAVSSRCFSACRAVFSQLVADPEHDKRWQKEEIALWDAMQKYSQPILGDRSARKKEKIAVIAFSLGRKPFGAFCRMSRRLGLMR